MAYYVNRYDAPIHVWDEDDVDYIEPPKDEGEPFWDPIAETVCGQSLPGAETEPMEVVAPSLREYVRRDPDKKCPGCIVGLMERHNLPDSLRTDGLEERIDEWQSAHDESDGLLSETGSLSSTDLIVPEPSESRTVPPGSTEADVVDAARDLMEDMERAGKDLSDLALTVSPDVMDTLQSHTFEVRRSVTEPMSLDGVPVLEDTEADGPGEMAAMDFETVQIDLEVEAMDEAVRAAAESIAEDGREMTLEHPTCRSGVTPPTFTGTCVQAGEPVVLDDGERTVTVVDTSVLGEDARIGQKYEVPVAACEEPPRE